MKTLLTSMVLAAGIALPATADPFCSALETIKELPKKYQKRGPFYSDATSGWIIGADQLKGNYDVSDEAVELWTLIAAEFDARGAQLVVLAAPPRALFAMDEVIESLGLGDTFNRTEMADAFAKYIAALNSAGIVAPDLSELATSDAASAFYFKRDTHWTPQGAALSAAHLRAAIDGTTPAETLAGVPSTGTYGEKGSLSTVVENTCATRPPVETVQAPVFAQQGTAASLLFDADDRPHIALVGTSFSDRYQRDAYQVADALTHALDGVVENHALTGGGLIGSMSAFIQSGALSKGGYKTVVWETPYTTPLTHVDGLRQLLGELHALNDATRMAVHTGPVNDDWASISHPFNPSDYAGLEIKIPDHSTGALVIELIASDGSKTRVKLIKSDRIPSADRSAFWRLSFAGLNAPEIARIKVRLIGEATAAEAHLGFF